MLSRNFSWAFNQIQLEFEILPVESSIRFSTKSNLVESLIGRSTSKVQFEFLPVEFLILSDWIFCHDIYTCYPMFFINGCKCNGQRVMTMLKSNSYFFVAQ